jgi:hypothetical protein
MKNFSSYVLCVLVYTDERGWKENTTVGRKQEGGSL